jgi:hypothetical protein
LEAQDGIQETLFVLRVLLRVVDAHALEDIPQLPGFEVANGIAGAAGAGIASRLTTAGADFEFNAP